MDDAEFDDCMRMLTDAVDRVDAAVRTVPNDRWDDRFQSSEGHWSRRDLLAHIAANDLRQIIRVRVGAGLVRETDVLAAEQRVHEWNQARVDERRGRTVDELLAEMRSNRAALVTLLRSLTPEQRALPMPFRGRSTALDRMVPTLIGHLDHHAAEITSPRAVRRGS